MPQVGTTLTAETLEKVKKMASNEKRSVSKMVELLVERAISERERKRKGGSND